MSRKMGLKFGRKKGSKVEKLCQQFEKLLKLNPSWSLLSSKPPKKLVPLIHGISDDLPPKTKRQMFSMFRRSMSFDGDMSSLSGDVTVRQQTPSHPEVLHHYNESTGRNVISTADKEIHMNLNHVKHPSVEIRIANESQSALIRRKESLDASDYDNGLEVHEETFFYAPVVESYSHKLKHIVQELLKNESNYIELLKAGIENFMQPFETVSLPSSLDIPKFMVFSNIEVILEFHETRFLPALMGCGWNLEKIAHVFIKFIDGNQFDNYIAYVLNKQNSEKICRENKDFFSQLSHDKFGVGGFLLLPVQHLPRYKLLFIEIIKELLKDIPNHKKALIACCNAEKSIEKLIDKVDEHCG